MDLSQQSEIEQMQKWLRDRGQAVPDLGSVHEHVHPRGLALMPGMLTERQLAKLGRAEGRRFDRLFLRFMIRHHEGGALTMVRRLYAQGAAWSRRPTRSHGMWRRISGSRSRACNSCSPRAELAARTTR